MPLPSVDPGLPLGAAEREALAAIGKAALRAAVRAEPYAPPEGSMVGRLVEPGASFVTLRTGGELRGCIGSLEPRRALGVDVAENTRAAAREDFRFTPLTASELAATEIEVSILTAPVPLPAASRAELLTALVPGVDGLVLEEHGRRATFLPSVWEQLAEPDDFVAQLERKAGLAVGGWSAARRAFRYRAEKFELGRAE